MSRKVFDKITSTVGLLLAAVLLTAGGLLAWGGHFTSGQVHTQLAAQKIVFPPASSEAITSLPKADRSAMAQYAGQPLTTGAQAKVYADNFIAVHLGEIGGGKTYSELSSAAMKSPDNAKLQAQVATMFKGTTLRSMLLNAYAWGTTGSIMVIASVVSFVAGGLLLLFSAFGFAHSRRADT